jgi:peptide/nickel transport system substrate-binding protein
MAVLIQAQLKGIGVDVKLDEVEFSSFWTRLGEHDFEAALASWNLGTNPALGINAWTTRSAREKGGLNYSSYMSPRFDAYADSAIEAMDSADSRRLYTTAYQTAIDDAPAVWLYEPRMVLGINRRIRIGPLRADCWWYSLADWSIH